MSEEVTAEQTNETEVKTEVEKSSFEAFQDREKSFSEPKEEEVNPSEKKAVKPATPVKEAENKEESEEADPEKETDSDPIEKRLKDKDRYITRQQEELKELKLKLSKRDKVIHKFGSEAVVYDNDGDPIDFRFDDKKEKSETAKEDAEPPLPTGDEPLEVYTDMIAKRAEWKYEQKQKAKEEAKQREQEVKTEKEEADLRDNAFKEAVDENIEITAELFPDLKDTESKLFKEADKIFKANPKLKYRPDCNFICFSEAAKKLGIPPVTSSDTERTEKRDIKITPKKNLMELGSQGGKDSLNMDTGFMKFRKDEQRFQSKD